MSLRVAPTPLRQGAKQVDLRVPVDAATVTPAVGTEQLYLKPAGALASLTINMPASPQNGNEFNICSTQAITTVTLSGATIVGAITTLTAGGFASYIYNATNTEWCRNG